MCAFDIMNKRIEVALASWDGRWGNAQYARKAESQRRQSREEHKTTLEETRRERREGIGGGRPWRLLPSFLWAASACSAPFAFQ